MSLHPHQPPTRLAHPLLLTGTIITFDDVPDGTIVDYHYASKGITFRSQTVPPTQPGHAYARSVYGASDVSSNVVSVFSTQDPAPIPAFDSEYGGEVEATFATPQLVVSIRAFPVPTPGDFFDTKPYMDAFTAGGTRIQRVEFPLPWGDPHFMSWQRMICISSQVNIASVRFSSLHVSTGTMGSQAVLAMFDRLYFSDRKFPYSSAALAAFFGP